MRPLDPAAGADELLGAGSAVGDALAAEVHPEAAAIARDHALPVVVPTPADARDLPILLPTCTFTFTITSRCRRSFRACLICHDFVHH